MIRSFDEFTMCRKNFHGLLFVVVWYLLNTKCFKIDHFQQQLPNFGSSFIVAPFSIGFRTHVLLNMKTMPISPFGTFTVIFFTVYFSFWAQPVNGDFCEDWVGWRFRSLIKRISQGEKSVVGDTNVFIVKGRLFPESVRLFIHCPKGMYSERQFFQDLYQGLPPNFSFFFFFLNSPSEPVSRRIHSRGGEKSLVVFFQPTLTGSDPCILVVIGKEAAITKTLVITWTNNTDCLCLSRFVKNVACWKTEQFASKWRRWTCRTILRSWLLGGVSSTETSPAWQTSTKRTPSPKESTQVTIFSRITNQKHSQQNWFLQTRKRMKPCWFVLWHGFSLQYYLWLLCLFITPYLVQISIL